MKKKWTVLLSLFLAVMMTASFMPQAVFAEGNRENVQLPAKIEEPYMAADFYEMQMMNALALSDGMDETAVSAESHGYGALIKGPVSEIESGRIKIAGEFDFTGNPVGRISLHGVAEKGVLVDALIYLDDDPEPVCAFTLNNRSAQGGWNIGEVQTENVYSKKITGTHKVSVGFRVIGKRDSQIVNILLRSIELSEDPGIPTMYFNIDENRVTIEEMNSSEDHSVRCYGSVDIKVPDGYQSEYETSPMEDLSVDLDYIRGRGNSTWGSDKKPYRFKLASKENLFGMGSNAHWVLLANRYDNSLLRNRMTYWLGKEMGMESTPQCVPVDVVMNGEYYGSYLLCEQIRIGKSRVNIDELSEDDITLPKISGGYLLAMSPYDNDDKRSVFETKRGVSFMNNEPDFVEYENPEQTEYIRGYIQDTEDAIFGDGFKNAEGKSWQEYMDLNAAAFYWWVQEFSRNGDAYGTSSTYLYKKRNGKLFWGPLWDFDFVAWGDLETKGDPNVEGFTSTNMKWFNHLLGDPEFTNALTERWPEIDRLVTEIVKDGGILDQYYEQTKISQRYDHEKYGYYDDIADPNRPYTDEIEQLREWVSCRQTWVNENLESLKSLTNEVTFIIDGNVIEKLIVKKRMWKSELPEAPEKDGYIFEGWYTKPEGGDKLAITEGLLIDDDSVKVSEDMTLYAHYVEEKTASKADTLYVKNRVIWEDINEGTYYTEFVTLPQDAVDNRISWTSSNEETATVGKKGEVTMLKTGEVTITGTLKSGASISYELHIYDPKDVQLKAPEAIEVEDDEVTIEMGSYGYNPFTLLPEDEPVGGGFIFFESEDESVVVCGACGELYPMSPGTTTVKVTDYISDVGTSFHVTVIAKEEEPDIQPPIDAIDNAIAMLMQMNRYVNKADYTKASYDAYMAVYKQAIKTLKKGSLTADEISELRHSVVLAQLNLVKKKANTMKVTAKPVKVKRSKVKRKAVAIKRGKAITIKNAKGKVTFEKIEKGSSRNLLINKTTGKIKVKKKTKKGLYKIKVKVKAAGNGTYKPITKTVTVKIRVR